MNRYSSYKDSGVEWLGELPSHWERGKLNLVSHFIMGQAPHSDSYNQEGIGEIFFKTGDFGKKYPSIKWFTTTPLVFADESDIFMCVVGATAGKVNLGRKGTISRSIAAIRPLDIINKNILFYYFQSNYSEINEMSQGSAQGIINTEILSSIYVALPPLFEQQQIVNFLDDKTAKIDQLIAYKEKKIVLLKEKRTALINHVVTKGLNPDVEYKESGVEWIGDIPEHWDFVQVGHYNQVVRGGSPRPAGDPRFFNGDFIHWITVKDVTSKIDKYVLDTVSKLTAEGMKQSRVLESETLVLSNSGATLGVPAILKIKGCINDGVVAFLNLSPKLDKHFLYYFWTTQTKRLLEQQSGYGQPNLNIEIVSKLKFPLPPINIQQQIVYYLDKQTKEIDDLIQLEQQKIVLLKEYRQSLISEVVTGKLRVCEEDLLEIVNEEV